MQKVMICGNGHLPDHVKINDIVYLGANNCAMSKAYGWLYVQQNVSITDQFYKYGARHFKVPIHWYKEDNKQPVNAMISGRSGLHFQKQNPENSFQPDFEYRNKYNETTPLPKETEYLVIDFIDQGVLKWLISQTIT